MNAPLSKSNIALIGFMGTGKSAVGRSLARKLGRKFIELDAEIERAAGKPIPRIFQQEGEIAFRELEIATVKEIAKAKDSVISCGGGVVLNKINIDRLKENGVVVYLTADPAAISERTSRDKLIRPLLNVEDPVARIKELLDFRKPFYERAADITVDTSKRSIEEVSEEIINQLKK